MQVLQSSKPVRSHICMYADCQSSFNWKSLAIRWKQGCQCVVAIWPSNFPKFSHIHSPFRWMLTAADAAPSKLYLVSGLCICICAWVSTSSIGSAHSHMSLMASHCLFAVVLCTLFSHSTHAFISIPVTVQPFFVPTSLRPRQDVSYSRVRLSWTCWNGSNILNVFVWLTDSVTGSVRCQSCASLALRLAMMSATMANSECGNTKWKMGKHHTYFV